MAAQVVLATKNRHKLDELHRILMGAGLDVELLGIDAFPDLPDIPETESSFAGNALLKARAAALASGLPNAQVEIFAGASHFFLMEQPARFNRLLLGWLLSQAVAA